MKFKFKSFKSSNGIIIIIILSLCSSYILSFNKTVNLMYFENIKTNREAWDSPVKRNGYGGIIVYENNGSGLIVTSTDLGGNYPPMHWAEANDACNQLVLNGFDDWRLPTKKELNMIYTNVAMKGLGGFSKTWYWSSTESAGGSYWSQTFFNGIQSTAGPGVGNSLHVRAVRNFGKLIVNKDIQMYGGNVLFEKDGQGLVISAQNLGNMNWDDANNACNALSLNGYDDWHLPTPSELNKIYKSLDENGYNGFSSLPYWSSMEYNENNAWYQYFYDGTQNVAGKDGLKQVRAVRNCQKVGTKKDTSIHPGMELNGGIIVYEVNGKGLVVTPLDLGGLNYETANRVCNDLSLNGYNDWRLPTIQELGKIYENLKLNGFGGFSSDHLYWSSSEVDNRTHWIQRFSDGRQTKEGWQNNLYDVRAVRTYNVEITKPNQSNNESIQTKKVEAIGGIVVYENQYEGLVISQKDIGVLNWNDANIACNELVLNGYDDWRLPSKEELDRIYSTWKDKGIGGFESYSYWSSTEVSSLSAWNKYFSNGEKVIDNIGNLNHVRAVRIFKISGEPDTTRSNKESGSTEIESFWLDFQSAINSNNKIKIAEMTNSFFYEWNLSKQLSIKIDLLKNYYEIVDDNAKFMVKYAKLNEQITAPERLNEPGSVYESNGSISFYEIKGELGENYRTMLMLSPNSKVYVLKYYYSVNMNLPTGHDGSSTYFFGQTENGFKFCGSDK